MKTSCFVAILSSSQKLTIVRFKACLLCPSCGYENINPEPDEEGDFVCAECGEILEVKVSSESQVIDIFTYTLLIQTFLPHRI